MAMSTLVGPEICIILLIQIFSTDGANGDTRGILSRLYNQAHQENRPLILVLDNSNTENVNGMLNPKNTERTEINQGMQDPLLDLYEIIQTMKKKSPFKSVESEPRVNEEGVKNDRWRPRNRDRKQRFRQWDNKNRLDVRYKSNRYRDNQDISREIQDSFKNSQDRYNTQPRDKVGSNTKNILRSPLFRNFLRYSNSLRCAAKDECADECNDNFVGSRKDQCEEKCEDKYDCAEPTPDPCERGECEESDECGNDGCNVSTKGIKLVTETPKCKRC